MKFCTNLSSINLSQCVRLTDGWMEGQTERHTDRPLSPDKTDLHSMQRGKND